MWKRFLFLLCTALLIGAAPSLARSGSPSISVEKLSEITRLPQKENGAYAPLIHLPYFDEHNRLQWNEERISEAGGCNGAWFPEGGAWSPRCHRTTLMLNPRVDECRCIGKLPNGQTGSGAIFVGVDAQRREFWRRTRLSPLAREAPRLVGVGPGGMVFSDLQIWSPATGETIRPRDASGEKSFYATLHLPKQDTFLQFAADVTLFRSKGGLYLHRPESGERELVLPVDDSLTGYYAIEEMATLPGERWILLGERFTTRGPGHARFQVFDLENRRVAYSEELGKRHYISDVRVTLGTDGHVAFSFLDNTAGSYVLVHYRIGALK